MSLPGFENETCTLTQQESDLLPVMVSALLRHIGKDAVISSEEMRSGIKTHLSLDISPARIRKLINYIRRNDLIVGLIANSKGYYVTDDPAEITIYIESLDGRISAMQKIRSQMYEYLQQLLYRNSQLKLPLK